MQTGASGLGRGLVQPDWAKRLLQGGGVSGKPNGRESSDSFSTYSISYASHAALNGCARPSVAFGYERALRPLPRVVTLDPKPSAAEHVALICASDLGRIGLLRYKETGGSLCLVVRARAQQLVATCRHLDDCAIFPSNPHHGGTWRGRCSRPQFAVGMSRMPISAM